MATIRQAIESQSDIFDTIEAVKGKKYATFVRHSVGMTTLYSLVDNRTQHAFQTVMYSLMDDLADALGINIRDEAVQKSIVADIEALQLHTRVTE